MMSRKLQNCLAALTSAAVISMSGTVLAGIGEAGHGHSTGSSHYNEEGYEHSMETLAGKPGNESQVSRIIHVTADDSMRFHHEPFDIKDGETIKFVVTNRGAIPHEFAIGTKDEHMDHGKMMMANPDMHHGPGGNAVTVKPNETLALIWTFENAWQIEVACNIPGHYQAGMHSEVRIQE